MRLQQLISDRPTELGLEVHKTKAYKDLYAATKGTKSKRASSSLISVKRKDKETGKVSRFNLPD